MKRMSITFLAALAMLTLLTLAQPAKTHGYVLAGTMSLQGSPCFNVDPGIGNTSRDDHYRWAQQQDATKLTNNLAWKIGILFNCSSVSDDQLAKGFGEMSGIIGDYVSNPACFNNDQSVTGRDRSAHERWARTKTREQVRDNLQWKAVAAMKCLNRDQQVAFFADQSAALAKIPSGGDGGTGNAGGSLGGYWKVTCCNEELSWDVTINQQGNGFSGAFSDAVGGGLVTNGQLRGNAIEFDRSGAWGSQHWSGQLVNDGGRLKVINGIWTGAYLDRYPGRNNWHAEKK
jgi:hypothetical protein